MSLRLSHSEVFCFRPGITSVINSNKLSGSRSLFSVIYAWFFVLNFIIFTQLFSFHDKFKGLQVKMCYNVHLGVENGEANLMKKNEKAVLEEQFKDEIFEVVVLEGQARLIILIEKKAIGAEVVGEMQQKPPNSFVVSGVFSCVLCDSHSDPKKNKRQGIQVEDNGGIKFLVNQIILALHKFADSVCKDKILGEVVLNLFEMAATFLMHQNAGQFAVSEADAAMVAGILVDKTNQVLEEIADAVRDGQQAL